MPRQSRPEDKNVFLRTEKLSQAIVVFGILCDEKKRYGTVFNLLYHSLQKKNRRAVLERSKAHT